LIRTRRNSSSGARRTLTVLTLVAAAAIATRAGAETSDASSECNAYFPLRQGASWVYDEGEVSSNVKMRRTVTVQSVSTANGVTTGELVQQVSLPGQPDVVAGKATTRATCDSSGVQLQIDGSAGVGGEASGVIKARLPGLPAAADLKPGYSWRGDSEVETMDAGSKVLATGARGSRVTKTESVTVPAGTFPDALRIESVQTLTMHRGKDERYARQEIVEWYVSGIGLVKRETRVSHGANAAVSVEELQSYSGLRK
jgi:hypothetical protein